MVSLKRVATQGCGGLAAENSTETVSVCPVRGMRKQIEVVTKIVPRTPQVFIRPEINLRK